jgi:hypothetical protein
MMRRLVVSYVAAAADFADRYLEEAEAALRAGNLSWEQFWHLRSLWSFRQFGPRSERGQVGPLKHLLKELQDELLPLACSHPNRYAANEIVQADQLEEYADAMFLLMDALDRSGFTLSELQQTCAKKLVKNREREWQANTSDAPVEHVRQTRIVYTVEQYFYAEPMDNRRSFSFETLPKVGHKIRFMREPELTVFEVDHEKRVVKVR